MKKYVVGLLAYLTAGLVVGLALIHLFLPEKLTVEEVKENLPEIETISHKSFERLALDYNLMNNENVEITYDTEGNVSEVYESKIDERYKVRNNPIISEEAIHKDIAEFNQKRNDIIDGISGIHERKAMVFLIFSTVFIFTTMTYLYIHDNYLSL